MIFAAGLIREREDLRWQDLSQYVDVWLQNVGGYAVVALLIWLLFRWLRPRHASTTIPWPAWQTMLFRLSLACAFACTALLLIVHVPLLLSNLRSANEGMDPVRAVQPWGGTSVRDWIWRLGSLAALLAVSMGFLADVFKWQPRRIWAITRLSFMEAIRQRVLWVFSFLLAVFLFASWFINVKPENQVHTYVQVVYLTIAVLLLLTAGLMAAFSIPTDIKNQTIHTIVTKPVERFEIVLGRFFGYMLLITLILFAMTGFCLLYVVRGVETEARAETMRARIPIFGSLGFKGREQDFKGISVGREWEYRSYIGGTQAPFERSQRAIWSFNDLSPSLATRPIADGVKCEFSFDIFRTLKGDEGRGVFCSFQFMTRNWNDSRKVEVQEERAKMAQAGKSSSEIDRTIAQKFGFFEFKNKEIADYHTETVTVPVELFQNAMKTDAAASRQPDATASPELQVVMKCESGGQYVGVARHDLYILDAEQDFAINFLKGAFGIWCRLCLVTGIAVVCSTYLSAVISFLVTMVIYVCGYFRDYIGLIGEGKTEGGGPLENLYRMVNKEALVTELEKTPTVNLAQYTDHAYRWMLRQVVSIFPDVDRFDFTAYVADGFNLSVVNNLLLSFVVLLGYLIPCFLIGYYLIKSREIAS